MKEPVDQIMLFQKSYEGFESISDLSRDIRETLDERFNPMSALIPSEFQGTLHVRMIYVPYESPRQKLINMVEFNALPADKIELLEYLNSLEE